MTSAIPRATRFRVFDPFSPPNSQRNGHTGGLGSKRSREISGGKIGPRRAGPGFESHGTPGSQKLYERIRARRIAP